MITSGKCTHFFSVLQYDIGFIAQQNVVRIVRVEKVFILSKGNYFKL